MKTPYLAAVALACLCAHPVRAQDVEFADAVSRRVLMVNTRLTGFVDHTDSVSRRVLMVNSRMPNYVVHTDTVSRRTLLYNPPYTTDEAEKAVRIAAGLLTATPANLARLNIIIDEGSADKLDFRDAARIMRMVVGLDW